MQWINYYIFIFLVYLLVSYLSKFILHFQLDTLSADYEKVQKANSRLQKMVETLEDEKVYLQNEVDRLNKEAEMRLVIGLVLFSWVF